MLALPAVAYKDLPRDFRAKRGDLAGSGVEFKALPGEIKADRKKRRVELWIAAYGNVDLGGDLIAPGAAKRTITEDHGRGLVKFFLNHERPLGPMETLEEHKEGVLAVGRVTDHEAFDPLLAQIEDGTYGHGSVGYTAREIERLSADETRRRYKADPGQHKSVRILQDLRIWEGSAVIWPMNEQATITTVKGAAMAEQKSLFELSEVMAALARIQFLTSAEWAALTEEEAEMAMEMIQRMTEMEKCLRRGLKHRSPAPAPGTGSTAPAFDLKKLIDAAQSRAASITNLE